MNPGLRDRGAGSTYVGLQAAWHLLWGLAFTLELVYQVTVAHLNPIELVVVGTVLEATCFLGEIPTGIVADLYSRKLSILIGLIVMGSGIAMAGLFPSFWPILVAQVVWGVGFTFCSGAMDAWVTDEVGEDKIQPIFTRGHQFALAFDIFGITLAGVVAVALGSLQAPIIVGGAGFVALAVIMAFRMHEHGFAPTPPTQRETFARMAEITKIGIRSARSSGVVRSFLVIGLLTGLTSEVFDRLWVDRISNDFALPGWFGSYGLEAWFTLFALVASLIGLVASLAANSLASPAINAKHPTSAMALLSGLQVAGVVIFALAGTVWIALGGRWLRTAAASVGSPIQRAWLNRNVASGARATTGSMMSQADALGQVAGGPALGALAGVAGIPVALLVASAIQTPTLVLYRRLHPNESERNESERAMPT